MNYNKEKGEFAMKQWYELLFENYAAKPGAFSRNNRLTASDYEMLVITVKYISLL